MRRRLVVVGFVVLTLVAGLLPATKLEAAAPSATERYIVTASSATTYAGLKDRAVRRGATVVLEVRQLNFFVVETSAATAAAIASERGAADVSLDEIVQIAMVDAPTPTVQAPARQRAIPAATPTITPRTGDPGDPAMSYAGLLWDYRRMDAHEAWKAGITGEGIRVAVMDTGVDYTHAELRDQVVQVIDLADNNLCRRFYGISDDMLADQYGGPEDGDWHGHGTWIAGNIAAELDGVGTNGIAYDADLVAVKISEWCGFAQSSTLIAGFIAAADADVDVLNISFGGYGDNPRVFQHYVDAVTYARERGMAIVASAGNDATRLGTNGKVTRHGTLTSPLADEVFDPYGMWETPGGAPGVVMVSATNNRTVPSSRCTRDQIGTEEDPNSAVCKPLRDPHQAGGQGHTDQLAYYSNYGPRIDIAGPGGARKFNLPVWDRGGTPGFPYTHTDLTNVWETFSVTSNWGLGIPCFTFTNGSHFYPNECYSSIQGTSMAAPHVTAALALVASSNPALRGDVGRLVQRVEAMAIDPGPNHTAHTSESDTSPGDLFGGPCETGYCHLGGDPVPDLEAYGAGLVNVGTASVP